VSYVNVFINVCSDIYKTSTSSKNMIYWFIHLSKVLFLVITVMLLKNEIRIIWYLNQSICSNKHMINWWHLILCEICFHDFLIFWFFNAILVNDLSYTICKPKSVIQTISIIIYIIHTKQNEESWSHKIRMMKLESSSFIFFSLIVKHKISLSSHIHFQLS
jgi:hypothetical protein